MTGTGVFVWLILDAPWERTLFDLQRYVPEVCKTVGERGCRRRAMGRKYLLLCSISSSVTCLPIIISTVCSVNLRIGEIDKRAACIRASQKRTHSTVCRGGSGHVLWSPASSGKSSCSNFCLRAAIYVVGIAV